MLKNDENVLVVTANIIAKEDQIENLKIELSKLIASCQDHKGLLVYSLQQSISDKKHFLFYERFISMDAFKAHQNSPELAAWRKLAPSIVESSEASLWNFVAEHSIREIPLEIANNIL